MVVCTFIVLCSHECWREDEGDCSGNNLFALFRDEDAEGGTREVWGSIHSPTGVTVYDNIRVDWEVDLGVGDWDPRVVCGN